MNWETLKPNHYHKDPVEYIYTKTIFPNNDYDRLYENQNNINHQVWKDFDSKYKMGFEFKENFSEIDFDKEVMCLWFFKERSNLTTSYVSVEGKDVQYTPNTFLITTNKNLRFIEKKRKYIRNPLLQLDMSLTIFQNILKRFQK
tara:strand:- start:187 stop:618 length:432 start_codon:yes stop_codon:yes gene_type:complete